MYNACILLWLTLTCLEKTFKKMNNICFITYKYWFKTIVYIVVNDFTTEADGACEENVLPQGNFRLAVH
jgi:hypothetical protein